MKLNMQRIDKHWKHWHVLAQFFKKNVRFFPCITLGENRREGNISFFLSVYRYNSVLNRTDEMRFLCFFWLGTVGCLFRLSKKVNVVFKYIDLVHVINIHVYIHSFKKKNETLISNRKHNTSLLQSLLL